MPFSSISYRPRAASFRNWLMAYPLGWLNALARRFDPG